MISWLFHRLLICWKLGANIYSQLTSDIGKCCIDLNDIPDNKVHGAIMGPTWVLSAPDGPHVGPMNLAIWDGTSIVGSGMTVNMTCPVGHQTAWLTRQCANWSSKYISRQYAIYSVKCDMICWQLFCVHLTWLMSNKRFISESVWLAIQKLDGYCIKRLTIGLTDKDIVRGPTSNPDGDMTAANIVKFNTFLMSGSLKIIQNPTSTASVLVTGCFCYAVVRCSRWMLANVWLYGNYMLNWQYKACRRIYMDMWRSVEGLWLVELY